jgi:hypothetical protein
VNYADESQENVVGKTMTAQRNVSASGPPSGSDGFVTAESADTTPSTADLNGRPLAAVEGDP